MFKVAMKSSLLLIDLNKIWTGHLSFYSHLKNQFMEGTELGLAQHQLVNTLR